MCRLAGMSTVPEVLAPAVLLEHAVGLATVLLERFVARTMEKQCVENPR